MEIDPLQEQFIETYNRVGIKVSSLSSYVTTQQAVDGFIANMVDEGTAPEAVQDGDLTSTLQQPAGILYSGKKSFTDTATGYIIGVDPADNLPKIRIGSASNYIYFNGITTTIVGGLSVDHLDIPDVTTANSFHVDVSGNAWWGSNVATGYTGANAYILSTGAAVFKNVQIGGTTIQYVITNSGIFSYGDGSDGAAVFDGSNTFAFASKVGSVYTLTRDIYLTTGSVSDSVTVDCGGYRIFASVSLTVGGGTSGKIIRNGVAGVAGLFSFGGAGVSLPDGYLKGAPTTLSGGNGGTAPGNGAVGGAGASVSNSLGSNGSAGQKGGDNTGHANAGGLGGVGGTATISNVKLIANWHLATLLDISSSGSTVKFTGSAASGSGGGGAGGSGLGGGGGSAGTAGGIIAIYAKVLTINAGASIEVKGGIGGNGEFVAGGGHGGGGAGGNGGIIVLVYNTLTNNGSLLATGGVGGTGGGDQGGSDTAANSGSVGVTYQFQLSL